MNIKDKLFLSIGTIALVATLGFGANTMFNRNTESTKAPEIVVVRPTTNTTTTPTTTKPSTVVMPNNNTYKDGTYAATASYSVPRASNTISVNITIANNIVTNVTTTHKYTDSQSGIYVDSFDGAISSKVVGQSVSNLSLSRVGGASLTTVGFVQALNTVISNAAA